MTHSMIKNAKNRGVVQRSRFIFIKSGSCTRTEKRVAVTIFTNATNQINQMDQDID